MRRLTTRRITVFVMTVFLIASTAISGYAAENAVGPGDDFFNYVNEDFLKDKRIDPATGEWSVTSALAEDTDKRTDEIIEELGEHFRSYPKGSTKRKIADYYLSAKDRESREAAGLKGIERFITQVREADSIKELGYAWADISKYSSSLPVLISYETNPSDAERYIYYICGDTTDVDFSSLRKTERDAVKKYIATLLEAAGETEDEAKESAAGVLKYLKDMSYVSNVNYDKYIDVGGKEYCYYSITELQKLYPNLDIARMMEIMGAVMDEYYVIPKDKFIVEDPNFSKALSMKYLKKSKLEIMKDVTVFMLIDSLASQYECMPEAIQKANISVTNKLFELSEEYDFERQAFECTRFLLESEIGKLYTDRYFSEEMKAEARAMVEDIMEAYRNKIASASWLSSKTKNAALKKLDSITLNVGYPDGEWGNAIDTVDIKAVEDGGDCLSNVIAYLRDRAKPETPYEFADKSKWPLGVTEVNAMYSPLSNSVSIPAGILQPPFYLSGDDYDYAYNMGATGYTVAHEITHAFDNNGSKYDGKGNYKNWWTKTDKKRYKKLQNKMIKYYSKYKIHGINVDGELTLAENIADIGGLECVLSLIPNEEEDSLKTFFEGYARSWASKYTKETAKYILKNDEHAPDSVRVNGVVSSMDEFYEAYGVKKGDKMYIEPDKRVRLWN